jgi:hypothetical protein
MAKRNPLNVLHPMQALYAKITAIIDAFRRGHLKEEYAAHRAKKTEAPPLPVDCIDMDLSRDEILESIEEGRSGKGGIN